MEGGGFQLDVVLSVIPPQLTAEMNVPKAFKLTAPLPGISTRLFCLPYAGGSAAIYQEWQKQVAPQFQICAVELPGRGWRSTESLPLSIHALAHEIASSLHAHGETPFALFGHSMGARIAYEIARNLEAAGNRSLSCLIVSGSRAPFLPKVEPAFSNLSDSVFLDHIRQLNGTPPEIFADADLMSVVLPILRSDFKICEEYDLKEKHVLRIPITVLAGEEDTDISIADVEAWGTLTTERFETLKFPGDHFFIKSSEAAVVSAVNDTLVGLCGTNGPRHQQTMNI
jgi:medium-chain acyl-[acyl-carrier-protein] hydrolase